MSPAEHTVRPDAFADDAFAILKREHVRHLLVMRDGELVGVVSDRDLRRPDWGGKVLSAREMYLLGDELRVYDVMTEDVVTVTPATATADAARMMVEGRFNCLPVVGDDGAVVGVITSSDLLAALVREVEPEAVAARSEDPERDARRA
jgi:acetoin utilization protein AcuB